MDEFSLAPKPVYPPLPGQRHSKLGLASFILGCVNLLVFCSSMLISLGYGAWIAVNNPLAARDPFHSIDPSHPAFFVAVLLLNFSTLLSLIGIGLGIPAVVQKMKKKLFGIVGLVMNGLILVTYGALTVVGMIGQLGF